MPIVGLAPRCLLRVGARLYRCLRCAKGCPGAKRFSFDEVFPGVLLGTVPNNVTQVRQLRDEYNVGCFVTMNEAWEMPGGGRTTTLAEVRREGIQVLWLATPDYSAVRQQDLRLGADFVEDCVTENSKACYVHCNGGRGRSTSVVLAWLILHQRMDALSALRHIEGRRKVAKFLMCCGLRPQWRSIRKFEREFHPHRGRGAALAQVAPEQDQVASKQDRAKDERWAAGVQVDLAGAHAIPAPDMEDPRVCEEGGEREESVRGEDQDDPCEIEDF